MPSRRAARLASPPHSRSARSSARARRRRARAAGPPSAAARARPQRGAPGSAKSRAAQPRARARARARTRSRSRARARCRASRARTERLERVGLDAEHRRVAAARCFARKCCGEQRHVLAPLAQRRQRRCRTTFEPVVEVRAEAPRRDHRGEVAVASRAMTRTSTGSAVAAADRAHLALPGARAAASPARRAGSRRSRRGRACRRSPARNRPGAPTAPVKAPRSCPKSSLSMIDSGSAPQSTGHEGAGRAAGSRRGARARRAPCRCRSRPGSARVLSLWRRLAIVRWSARIARRARRPARAAPRALAQLAPRARGCGAPGGGARSRAARWRARGARRRRASRGSRRRRARMQPTALSMLAWPVITITSTSGRSRFTRSSSVETARARRERRSSSTTSSAGLGERARRACVERSAASSARGPRAAGCARARAGAAARRRPAARGRALSGARRLARAGSASWRAIGVRRAALSAARAVDARSRCLHSRPPLRGRRRARCASRTSSWSTTRSCTAERSSASSCASAIRSRRARDASEAHAARHAASRSTSCSATCACPASTGSSWCARSTRSQPDLPCIVVTGYGSAEASVEALRAGRLLVPREAVRPGHLDVRAAARRAGDRARPAEGREPHAPARSCARRYRFENIVGTSARAAPRARHGREGRATPTAPC